MDEKTEVKLTQYFDILKKQLDIEMIVVFGSYLTERYSNDSDIDVLVVASEFSKMNKLEAYKILSRPIWDVKLNIDPIPATPDEIKNYNRATFLSEIMNSGKVVFPIPA